MTKVPRGVGPGYPQVVTLMGATGDLAKRKLLPGLFHLSSAGFIPGCRIIGVSLENLDSDSFRHLARQAVDEFSTRKVNDADWNTFSQNLSYVPLTAGPAALKAAVASTGDASVIHVSSMYGRIAPDGRLYDRREQQSPFHYGPAKAALEQLTRHLAAELGPEKIRVNSLVPGPFPQPGKMPSGLETRLAARTMLGRIGQAQEIAGPLLFLAAPASAYVTGSSLVVDGGWTAW